MMSKLHMIRHQRRRRAYLQEVDRGSTPFATGILRALLEVAQRKGVATQCRRELKILDADGPVPEPGAMGSRRQHAPREGRVPPATQPDRACAEGCRRSRAL